MDVDIREVNFGDYPAVAQLQSTYGLQPGTYDAWSHLWTNNPVYQQWPRPWPKGWVLETSTGDIVGYLANIPLLYTLAGQHLTVATARAFVVHSDFRRYSFLLLERFFRQSSVDLHLNTTVNAQAAKAYALFRAQQVPRGAWDESVFWITGYRGFMESLVRSKRLPESKILSLPLATGAFLRNVMSRKLPLGKQDTHIQSCHGFDERFDDFWEQLQHNNKKLLAFRSCEMLNWHFKHALQQQRVWIVTAGSAAHIDAYAVFLRIDNPQFGLKRVRLVDFQSLTNDRTILRPMIASALNHCHLTGVHMLEIVGMCDATQKVLAPFIRYHRKLPSWLYVYRTKNKILAEILKNPEVWDPTGYDGDFSL